MNRNIKSYTLASLFAASAVVAGNASAAGSGWDYTSLTGNIDLSGLQTGALTAFGAMVVVTAGIWGGRKLIGIFSR